MSSSNPTVESAPRAPAELERLGKFRLNELARHLGILDATFAHASLEEAAIRVSRALQMVDSEAPKNAFENHSRRTRAEQSPSEVRRVTMATPAKHRPESVRPPAAEKNGLHEPQASLESIRDALVGERSLLTVLQGTNRMLATQSAILLLVCEHVLSKDRRDLLTALEEMMANLATLDASITSGFAQRVRSRSARER